MVIFELLGSVFMLSVPAFLVADHFETRTSPPRDVGER